MIYLHREIQNFAVLLSEVRSKQKIHLIPINKNRGQR